MDAIGAARICRDLMQWIYQVNSSNLSGKDGRTGRTFTCYSRSQVPDFSNSPNGPCSGRPRDNFSCNILNVVSTWQNKHPEDWDNPDILDWIYFTAGLNDIRLSALRGENFQGLVGKEFCKMSKEDFMKLDPEFGEVLYNSFVSLAVRRTDILSNDSLRHRSDSFMFSLEQASDVDVHEDQNNAADKLCLLSTQKESYCLSESMAIPRGGLIPATVQMSEMQDFSDDEVANSDNKSKSNGVQSNRKKRRKTEEYFKSSSEDTAQDVTRDNINIGKRKHSSKILLSNFMKDLLESPEYNPSCVRWEDKDKGIFRIISGKSKVVAELWGKIKNNPKMTFEKMGRSLRWCRDNNGNFSTVPKDGNLPKKLCFRLST